MIRSPRLARFVTALALVALPLVASAQGGSGLSNTTSIGMANRYVLFVGNDSTTFQKAEITWTSPASRAVAPRQMPSARSTDTDRAGAASVKFIRAVSDESQKVRTWLQRSSTFEPVHVTALDGQGKVVGTMTTSSFKAEKWSINTMDAGASQISIETLQLSTPSLQVHGPAFGN